MKIFYAIGATLLLLITSMMILCYFVGKRKKPAEKSVSINHQPHTMMIREFSVPENPVQNVTSNSNANLSFSSDSDHEQEPITSTSMMPTESTDTGVNMEDIYATIKSAKGRIT